MNIKMTPEVAETLNNLLAQEDIEVSISDTPVSSLSIYSKFCTVFFVGGDRTCIRYEDSVHVNIERIVVTDVTEEFF